MKKRILLLVVGCLFIGINLFAADGDLIVNGNVGIGTTTPTQKLDVSGQIHATNDICTDANGGKCLTTIVPSGVIMAFGGDTAPSGYLMCNGAAVSRTTYAALFAVIREKYGVGDRSTTFNLPDLRQKFPLGKADSGTGSTLGEAGGLIDTTQGHALTIPEMPYHNHTMPSQGVGGQAHWYTGPSGDAEGATGYTGGNQPHSHGSNPPFQVVNFIIKY